MLTKEETTELIRVLDNSISVLHTRLSVINKLVSKDYELTEDELKEFSKVVKTELTNQNVPDNLLSGFYKIVK